MAEQICFSLPPTYSTSAESVTPELAPTVRVLAMLIDEASYEHSQGRHFSAMAIERVARKFQKSIQ